MRAEIREGWVAVHLCAKEFATYAVNSIPTWKGKKNFFGD